MLTEQQVEFIHYVSGRACFGVVMGAVCGLLVTAAMLIKQRRRGSGIGGLVGPLHGLVPGAVGGAISAVIFSSVAGLVEATYCEPAPQGGYVLPDWLDWLLIVIFVFVSLLAAGIAARMAIPDVNARQKPWSEVWRSAIAWSAIGALIGAVAGVGWGFDGYFVVQSNAGPIRCAIVGAAFLAIGSLLWRLTTGLNLSGSDRADQAQAHEVRWTQLSGRTRMAFVLAWSAFLFMVGISTFGTVGVAFVLGIALWVGVIVIGRLNARLAWLCFVVFCAVQPLIAAVSHWVGGFCSPTRIHFRNSTRFVTHSTCCRLRHADLWCGWW